MERNGNHVVSAPHAARTVALRIFIVFILSLLVLAQATALTVTAPGSVSEGETVSVSMTGGGTLSIYLDGTLVQSGTGSIAYDQITDGTSSGTYEYVFSSSTEGNETRTVTVYNVPLTVTVTGPGSEVTANPVDFTADTNWPATCTITVDSTTYPMAGDTSHSASLTVSEGVHALVYTCTQGSETIFVQDSLLVDTLPPVILSSSPSGTVEGPFVTLSVDTDEISICRYGTEDLAYESLPHEMGQQYVLNNQVTLELAQGGYTYFVRCQDIHGSAMQSSRVISFTNDVPPTAKIDLDTDDDVLTAGTYEVTLVTSVDMAETPSLTYRLDPSGASKTVGLTGNDDVWDGFITIEEDETDTVLTFSFSGKNSQGVTGTEITKGGVFEIDASRPEKITDISVFNTSGYIKLVWAYDDDDDYTFNIYRSTIEDVTEADYLTTVSTTTFTDLDLVGTTYHYYRIAAVDDANNVGVLSEVIWGATPPKEAETLATDPVAREQLETEIELLTTAVLEANNSITRMEEERNPTRLTIIEDMQLLPKARSARLQLEEELRALRQQLTEGVTQQQASAAVEQASAARIELRKYLITRIEPETETETQQPTDADSLERNLAYPLTGANADEATYLYEATQLQDRLTVRLRAHSFTLWDVRGVERPYTFVEKTITLDTPANDITLLEVIPKEVAQHTDDITFSKEPVILETDPVVQYTFPVLERETFSYYVQDIVGLDVVKQTRTLAYPEPTPTAGNLVTGKVTADTSSFFSWDALLVIAGVLIIIGLAAYYFTLSQEPEPFQGLPAQFVPVPKPRRRAPPRRRIVARPLTKKAPEEMIAEAEQHIDRKEYESALDAYKNVLQAMEKHEGGDELNTMVVRVYKKLLLHKQLDDAHRALEEKKPGAVRTYLDQARETAQDIGDQNTPLMQSAKDAFTSCWKQLNTLEIERLHY